MTRGATMPVLFRPAINVWLERYPNGALCQGPGVNRRQVSAALPGDSYCIHGALSSVWVQALTPRPCSDTNRGKQRQFSERDLPSQDDGQNERM